MKDSILTILKKHRGFFLATSLATIFFLGNLIWIYKDTGLPFIGDDSRYLQATYEMYSPIKDGNLSEAYNRWETLFIHPDRFPRTPLFAMLSVPSFLIFGVSEDIALATNVFVLFVNSLLLFCLTQILFKQKSKAQAVFAGLVTVLLYNTMPGFLGYARLYMSETLQTTFVLLIVLFVLKYGKKAGIKEFFVLGIVSALAILLRFLMPFYLLIPALLLIYLQISNKEAKVQYLRRIVAFLFGFIPLFLTWYGNNLAAYIEFTKFTSSGSLASFYSLGPVSDPMTAIRFGYIIVTWLFGWPAFLLSMFLLLVFIVRLVKKYKQINFKQLLLDKRVLLLLTPIPFLITLFLSESKTARYFVPVMALWLPLLSYLSIDMIKNIKAAKYLVGFLLILIAYPFMQTIFGFLPRMPLTGMNPANAFYREQMSENLPYDFFLDAYKQFTDKDYRIYNLAEQPSFNDAQLIWYATQKGVSIKNSHEFSRYTSLEDGYKELEKADIVVVTNNPEGDGFWIEKYLDIAKYVRESNDFMHLVTSEEFTSGRSYSIYLSTKTFERISL
ncbi:glycosyltransferase family 39 protein [Candidatus Dojkabacteria bacterium]|uniref:Glycosyltransferase family 39 protein n=1 Tax=Candidatus Dojkabacteria bacterium TaxID=2099670 RepID=A0A952AIE1_9BACT|nr:glycosyltransferase family 39 protein [Candidatus Dojkabacteria bacterium]